MANLILLNNFPGLIGCLMAVLGACLGSFAAVVIFRMPRGQSIITPRSYCPACTKQLKVWHNIPVLSWLILRGKCAYCRSSIGLRNLVIELIFSLCLLALYIKFGFGMALTERFIFVFLLVCLAYVDLDTFTLPYSLLFWLVILGMVSSVIYFVNPSLYLGPSQEISLLKLMVFRQSFVFSLSDRLWGAAIGLLLLSSINLLATFFLRRSGRLTKDQWAMGWGDPLLAMAIGIFVGLSHLVLVIFLASALGSVCGLACHFLTSKQPVDADLPTGALPYGPFLAIAAIYVYLF